MNMCISMKKLKIPEGEIRYPKLPYMGVEN